MYLCHHSSRIVEFVNLTVFLETIAWSISMQGNFMQWMVGPWPWHPWLQSWRANKACAQDWHIIDSDKNIHHTRTAYWHHGMRIQFTQQLKQFKLPIKFLTAQIASMQKHTFSMCPHNDYQINEYSCMLISFCEVIWKQTA